MIGKNEQEIIEDKIIDLIAEQTKARFITTKSAEQTPGIDLIVKKRAEYEVSERENSVKYKISSRNTLSSVKTHKAKEIYLKIIAQSANEDNLEENIPEENLRAQKDLYLLFVSFDEIKQEIGENLWLAPALDLAKIKKNNSKYKISKKDFGSRLFEILK